MLNPDVVARVKACKGVYSVGDTARHFGISKSTVSDLWNGKRFEGVPPIEEPPNVKTSRVPPDVIKEDGAVLIQRGLSPTDAAHAIGISRSTLYYHMGSVLVFGV